MNKHASSFPSRALLQQIWNAHRLGEVRHYTQPAGGSVNHAVVVNDSHVIRFNINPEKGAARFRSEEMAYSHLRRTGVPVPEAVVIDLSQRLVPYAYLICTKLEGQPLVVGWPGLPPHEQEQTAYLAGVLLGRIHDQTFGAFGSLHTLSEGRFATWHAYVADYLQRYADRALSLELVSPETLARLLAVPDRHRALLDTVSRGALLHSDYHFENMLQSGGVITGILDFEWALAGDPAWDFIAEDQWEAQCPGSRRFVYEGYTHHRPLPAQHRLRVQLYKLLLHVETLVDNALQGQDAAIHHTQDKVFAALHQLER